MHTFWQGLLANLTPVVAVIALWTNVKEAFESRGQWVLDAALGSIMGGGAILAITFAVPFTPGVIFDLRITPLAVAGLFGGPLAAAIAAGSAMLYRLNIGGAGTFSGCLAITLAAAIGTLYRWSLGKRLIQPWDTAALALLCAVAGVSVFITMRGVSMVDALQRIGLPIFFLNFVGVLVACLWMLADGNRRRLTQENELYGAVIAALPDCLNVKDIDGRFLAANTATAKLMRASSSLALVGKTDFDFYPEPTARRFRNEELACLAAGQEETIEQQADFANGRSVWLSTLKVPFRDSSGAIIGLITHNRDVTAAKMMERQLQIARQQLADALTHMGDGLVMYDRDIRISMCNDQYRSMFPLTGDIRVPGAALADILKISVDCGEEALPQNVELDDWIDTVIGRVRRGGERVIALQDGRWIEARTRPTEGEGYLTVFSDVTARKQSEVALRHRAEHDPLTGLANRATFGAALSELLDRASRKQSGFAILLVDLDRFKQVNDTLGHATGDHLLVEVGRRILGACRNGDLVARLGGDEFAVLSEGTDMESGAPRLAQRILNAIERPIVDENVSIPAGASIGISIFPRDAAEAKALMRQADEALYAAKAGGRGRWETWNSRAVAAE